MPYYKRSQFFLITIENPGGSQKAAGVEGALVITSLISGEHLRTEANEIASLAKVPISEWTEESGLRQWGFSKERIAVLESFGVLLGKAGGELEEYGKREEALLEAHWPPCAAIFHLINHAQESRRGRKNIIIDAADEGKNSEDRAKNFLDTFGPPPAAFYEHPGAGSIQSLPRESSPTELSRILRRRRTARVFQSGYSLQLPEVANLLELVFSPTGFRVVGGMVQLLLKTSPSGGSLHPVEAYPLFFKCEGVPTGLYHYRADCHGLEALEEMPENVARTLAIHFAQGQSFVGSCSAIVILVARFDRHFWKYRDRENSYSVVLQDAGHLSQTFQIVATDLGLGTFYTAALNPQAIVDRLSLQFPIQAPIGLLGLGESSGEDSGIHPFGPSQGR